MGEVSIPEPFQRALVSLGRLDDDAFASLVTAIEDLPPFSPVEAFQAVAKSHFPSELHPEASRLIPAVISMRVSTPREISHDRLAADTANSVDLDLDPPSRTLLERRLVPLLRAYPLTSTGSAIELLSENTNNYQSARVITDIRPVFGEDVEQDPAGVVIMQTLRLATWSSSGEEQQFYITMDDADLRELGETIDRALKKGVTLRTMLRASEITTFELDTRLS